MAPLKVLIIGGGITGPALGFWLAKLQCDITILERSPDLRASGQQIDIRGQGVTCMRRMGLERDVRDKVVDEQGFKLIDIHGRTKALFEANKTGRGKQSMTSEFEIMRGDLVRILYGKTKDTCRYLFGTTVEDFEQRGDGVWVKFSDGKEEGFDLVVGADGQGSRTRRKMLGPDATDAFKSFNLYLCYYTVPKTDKDENYAVALLLPGRRVVSTRVDNPKTMQVYLGVMDPNAELTELEEAARTGNMEKQKAIYLDMFKDAGWETPRLLDGLKKDALAKDFYGQRVGQVRMDKPWSKGRVVLLGDAAYCPSPVSGVGTSLGLVGPYVLAGEIAKQLRQSSKDGSSSATTEDHGRVVDAALDSYEKVLRPFVETTQKLPPGVPGIVYAETEWGVWIRNFIFGLFSTLRIDKIISRFSSDDFGGGWKLPEYPELKYEID
ncbi:hypothetical protein N0V82_010790 [Gnomoniopsis sp. IMI 355080]|nr:hypothetical protein N0V82_010790 [Gnomoniopsis sp. IMI 355080]